jgi:hypothetical protein
MLASVKTFFHVFHAFHAFHAESNSSVKKRNFSVKKSTFFHARATFFNAGEKAGFGYSAVEGSLINLLRTLYGQG